MQDYYGNTIRKTNYQRAYLGACDVIVTHRTPGYAHIKVEGICDADASDTRVKEVAIFEVWGSYCAPFDYRDFTRSMDGTKFSLIVHTD